MFYAARFVLIGLLLFADEQKPVKYLFPSTVWQTPDLLFTNTAVNMLNTE